MDLNNVTIIGRLATMPVMKGYKKADETDGFRTWFRVAVCRNSDLGRPRNERRTNFIPVTCWGKLAQITAEHLEKGTEVGIEGEFIAESRPKPNTSPVEYEEFYTLQARKVQFGRRSGKNQGAQASNSSTAQALEERVSAAGAGAIATGEENPFEQAAQQGA